MAKYRITININYDFFTLEEGILAQQEAEEHKNKTIQRLKEEWLFDIRGDVLNISKK